MSSRDCVAAEALRAFLLGDLPEALALAVCTHLEGCPECEEAARRLDDLTDPLIRSLQRALGAGRDATHPRSLAATPGGDEKTVPEATGAPPELCSRHVGGYEVLEELGRGGMGVVYKARQFAPNRVVALKMILAGGYADSSRRARFLAEGDAIARLQHPNIVQIHEVGQHEGLPFLVLEYIGGGTLADHLAGVPQPPRRAAELTETLARAVHHAHTNGVVHRDLKPQNVLVGEDGRPRITDFGLARYERPELTGTGDIIGTPSYMAPEQAGGGRPVGPAADVWALGAILYECLTGRPPFKAATPLETVEQVCSQEPVAPIQLRSKTPGDLNTVCLKCLEKDPARRYGSAAELADDLRRFLNGEPVQARPVGALARGWRWCRRNRPLAAVSGLAVAALAAVVVVSISFGVSQYRASTRLRTALTEKEEQRREADTFAARLALDRALSRCGSNDAAEGMLWLAAGLESATRAGDEGLQRAFRTNLAAWRGQVHGLRGAFGGPELFQRAVFSPDGKILLTLGPNSAQLWESATGRPVGTPLKVPFMVQALAVSSTGTIALSEPQDHSIRVFDLVGGQTVIGPLAHPDRTFALAFSWDGKTLLTTTAGRAWLWESATGRPVRQFAIQKGLITSAAFSPDGKTVLTGSATPRAGLAQQWEVATGQAVGKPLVHERTVTAGAISPDGKTVLTGCADRTARLWAAATGEPVGPSLAHDDTVCSVAFSPDGGTFVTGCETGTVQLWDAVKRLPRGALLSHQASRCPVAFSHDGRTLWTVGSDNTVRARAIAANQFGRVLQLSHPAHRIAVSPDGRTLLTVNAGAGARLWDFATGRPRGQPLQHEKSAGLTATAEFSADGRTVLTRTMTEIRAWDADTGEPHGAGLPGQKGSIPLTVDRAGRVAVTTDVDGTVRLWDLGTARALGRPLAHSIRVATAHFDANGRTLLTLTADGTARLWEVGTGSPLGPALRHSQGGINLVALGPDGSAVLTGDHGGMSQLLNTATGQPIGPPLHHPTRIVAAQFSPNGRTALTSSLDGTCQLREAATGRVIGPPLSCQGAPTGVAFSPDGATILTGNADGSARLWDVATCTPLGPVLRHQPGPVRVVVAFSPDGRTAVTVGSDRAARVWPMPAPVTGEAERITLWTQVLTGLELNDGRGVTALDARTWQERGRRLEELGGPPLQ